MTKLHFCFYYFHLGVIDCWPVGVCLVWRRVPWKAPNGKTNTTLVPGDVTVLHYSTTQQMTINWRNPLLPGINHTLGAASPFDYFMCQRRDLADHFSFSTLVSKGATRSLLLGKLAAQRCWIGLGEVADLNFHKRRDEWCNSLHHCILYIEDVGVLSVSIFNSVGARLYLFTLHDDRSILDNRWQRIVEITTIYFVIFKWLLGMIFLSILLSF